MPIACTSCTPKYVASGGRGLNVRLKVFNIVVDTLQLLGVQGVLMRSYWAVEEDTEMSSEEITALLTNPVRITLHKDPHLRS